MKAKSLRQAFERIDAALTSPAELWIRSGAALLALGYEGRVTSDIDVLPALPERFRRDPVLVDNLRYILEDLWGSKP